MLTPNHKTQISAAVLVLLAGCGGGGDGGSDRAVSSSPTAPGSTTINANISTGSTAVSGASSEATAGGNTVGGNAAPGTGTTGTAEAPTSSPADRSRAEAEARAREQAAAQARAKAEAEARDRALAEAQARARDEAAARARAAAAAEAEAKARAEERARAEAKAQADAQAAAAEAARVRAEREAQAAAEAAAKARAEAEARRQAAEQAAARAKAEAEEKARQEAEARAKAEAETKARAEAEARKASEDKDKANAEAQTADQKAAEATVEAEQAGKAREQAEQQSPVRDTEVEGQLNARRPTIEEPMNTAGISGDVLAAMLDQVVAGGMAGAASAITQAQPQANTPNVVVNAPQAPEREYMNAAPAPGAYTEATSTYRYRTSMMPGGGTAEFTTVHLGVQVSPSADALSLPSALHIATGDEQLEEGMTLTAGAITLPRNERQDFGHVIREWKNGESSVQLMLRTGNAANNAQMCWNYALPAVGVNRLQCNHWEVPEDWKRGEALRFKGVTITEKKDGVEHTWQSQP